MPSTAFTRISAAAQVQHRTLRVLVASQILSGAGLAAGVTVGALLAQDMFGTTSLAGLPSALLTAGSALAAIIVGRISQALGRRPGLAAGYFAGALGSAGVLTAAALHTPALLFIALFVYGAGTATNLQARYAGADLATPSHRARAVSTVLVATTLGGIAGPNLAAPTGTLAQALGLPNLAGPFLLSGFAYALAGLVLTIWLRPDPLIEARHRAIATHPDATPDQGDAPATHSSRRGVALAALVMVFAQCVMVAIMTMTPVHMHDNGHGTAASGLVIAIHIGAMYLPSPLTGRLVDRYGTNTVAAAAGVTLLAAGIVAAAAPADSVVVLALALTLLGAGWNFGLVSGTAMLAGAAPLATRAKTQGTVDVCVAIAGAVGGVASGMIVDVTNYSALALTGGILSLALLAVAGARGRSVTGSRQVATEAE
ncbi:MFS transporter [Streptomyces sp. NPDC001705]